MLARGGGRLNQGGTLNLITMVCRRAWAVALLDVLRVGFLLQAHSTLTDTQRAAAALPVCCKCAGVMAELRGASHSSSSRRFDRLAAPALLPPGLVDAVVAQLV